MYQPNNIDARMKIAEMMKDINDFAQESGLSGVDVAQIYLRTGTLIGRKNDVPKEAMLGEVNAYFNECATFI